MFYFIIFVQHSYFYIRKMIDGGIAKKITYFTRRDNLLDKFDNMFQDLTHVRIGWIIYSNTKVINTKVNDKIDIKNNEKYFKITESSDKPISGFTLIPYEVKLKNGKYDTQSIKDDVKLDLTTKNVVLSWIDDHRLILFEYTLDDERIDKILSFLQIKYHGKLTPPKNCFLLFPERIYKWRKIVQAKYNLYCDMLDRIPEEHKDRFEICVDRSINEPEDNDLYTPVIGHMWFKIIDGISPVEFTKDQLKYFLDSLIILVKNGINHRDLSSKNIIVNKDNNPIIIDFDSSIMVKKFVDTNFKYNNKKLMLCYRIINPGDKIEEVSFVSIIDVIKFNWKICKDLLDEILANFDAYLIGKSQLEELKKTKDKEEYIKYIYSKDFNSNAVDYFPHYYKLIDFNKFVKIVNDYFNKD